MERSSTLLQRRTAQAKPPAPPRGTMKRAAQYLLRNRGLAFLPYIFLLIATLSQLVVPRLVRNVIDAVTSGVTAKALLENLPNIPQTLVDQALPKILDFLNLPANWTYQQVLDHLTAQQNDAPRTLLIAGATIVLFAALRAVFAFLQAYWAERNSQSVAFDLRNDL